jgi:hypothetical protein
MIGPLIISISIYMKAYTYYVYHPETGKKYYGSRYSKDLNKTPEEDLWVTYFTSSPLVHKLIEEYGKDSFEYEVRKTFQSIKEAYAYEQRVLRRLKVTVKDVWLNKAYFAEHCICEMTPEVRKKISEKLLERIRPAEELNNHKTAMAKFKGIKRSKEYGEMMSKKQKEAGGYGPKKHSKETRQKMSKALKGRVVSEETKKKMSEAGKNKWKIRDRYRSPEASEKSAAKLRGIPRSTDIKKKISEGKKGTKRKYLPDGSYVMVKPPTSNDINL